MDMFIHKFNNICLCLVSNYCPQFEISWLWQQLNHNALECMLILSGSLGSYYYTWCFLKFQYNSISAINISFQFYL